MDLSKTQFLVTKGDFTTTITAYRRKRTNMLFNREGKPLRTMGGEEWFRFLTEYPEEIKADGLYLKVVWALVPIA